MIQIFISIFWLFCAGVIDGAFASVVCVFKVSGRPFTCFDAQHYGTLMLVDSEEEYYAEEVAKLRADVEQAGMGLLVFGEWYNRGMLEKMRFYDDNTRSWCSPLPKKK
jgi:hypothetical protein